MLAFRLTISTPLCKDLERALQTAQRRGDIRLVKRLLAIFALRDSHSPEQVAALLKVSVAAVLEWAKNFLCYKLKGLQEEKSPGRSAKLSKSQKRELADLLDAGPTACGFSSACWRSPMIQQLIHEKFAVFYSVFYIAQRLKSLGFSYQKAKFVADHLDEENANSGNKKPCHRRLPWRGNHTPICCLAMQRAFRNGELYPTPGHARDNNRKSKPVANEKPTKSSVCWTISPAGSFRKPPKAGSPQRLRKPF